jgi:hypothetical protein
MLSTHLAYPVLLGLTQLITFDEEYTLCTFCARMKWAGHVARMGQESVQGFGVKARRKETAPKTKA